MIISKESYNLLAAREEGLAKRLMNINSNIENFENMISKLELQKKKVMDKLGAIQRDLHVLEGKQP